MAEKSQRDIARRNPGRSNTVFRILICMNLFISLLILAIPLIEVEAADITVNTTDDELNSDGDCSLREAIQAANTNSSVDACSAGASGLDTITLPAGTFVLSTTDSMTPSP